MARTFVYVLLITCVYDPLSNGMSWIGTFPDLEGCMTQGESLNEVFVKAKEALALYYKYMNGNIPEPTSYEELTKKYEGKMMQLVELDTSLCIQKTKTLVKKNLTIPEWLNALAEKYSVNFSAVLKNALIQHLLQLETISNYERKLLEN